MPENRGRMTSRRVILRAGALRLMAGFFTLAGVLATASVLGAAPAPLYFTAVGTNAAGISPMRTQFELVNPGSEVVTGTITFFRTSGSPLPLGKSFSWEGNIDEVQADGSGVRFSVKPGSVAALAMSPGIGTALGWAKVEISAPLDVRVSLQIARHRIPILSRLLPFEDQLERVIELQPTGGLKSFTFPVWLWLGHRPLSTSFAVANLSGVAGKVELTLGPGGYEGDTKTVVLEPGELLSDYFENFWEFAVPAIFPFQLRSYVKVESQLPLGVTSLTTDTLSPLAQVTVFPKTAPAVQVPARSGEEVSLAVGEQAVYEAEGISIEFWDVVADSRCPEGVECVWQGEGIVELVLQCSDGTSERLRLSNPAGSVPDWVSVGTGARLGLVRLEPVALADQKLLITDYRAILLLETDLDE